MKTIKIISALLLLSFGVFGQQSGVSPAFFRLTGFSGQVYVDGYYREHEIRRPDLSDTAHSFMLGGGLQLNANGYFWHPNFLMVDLAAEYAPLQSRDRYTIIPDEGETRTLKRLDIHTTLFQKKIVSLTAFANAAQTMSNREFLSDIKTDSKNFGGVFYLRSKILPLSVSYQQGKIIQEELNTGRLFSYDNSNLEGRINKSFGKRSTNELIYSHTNFTRVEKDLAPVKNDLQEVTLTDELFFGRKMQDRFHSMINWADQKGYDTLTRKQAFETVSFKLPWKFELIGNYNYYDIARKIQAINQQTWRGMLRHKLYESLNSSVFYENTDTKETAFDQKETRAGFSFFYEKKIPTGQLNLSYNYLLNHQEKSGASAYMQIFHEEYLLVDGQIVLMKHANINATTVVVRDVTGTTVYQLNLDYIIIPHGNYLEIQRVPGGQIANNTSVFIDYSVLIPGSYQYDMQNVYWTAGINLFKKLVGLYYRSQKQTYFNLRQTDFVTLDSITQHIYGFRSEYKSFNGGVEYDDYKSSILPYKQTRYYIGFQGQYKQKLLYSLNANLSEYDLVKENIHQEYTDLSGQLAYNLSEKSKLNLELGYRRQTGEKINIDLELLNARLEYTTMVRRIYISVGVQAFRRNYMQEVDNYNGAFFRIARRF